MLFRMHLLSTYVVRYEANVARLIFCVFPKGHFSPRCHSSKSFMASLLIMSTKDRNEIICNTKASAVLRLFGTSWAPCGYCKGTRSHLSSQHVANRKSCACKNSTDSSCSYAVYAQSIEPSLYEQLICNG